MEDGWYNGLGSTHWLQPLLTLGVECSDDALTARANELTAVTVNPKAEAAAKIVNLVGGDGEKVKAFVRAVDPVGLPIWLELASIVFMSAALAKQRQPKQECQELRVSDNARLETSSRHVESVALEPAHTKLSTAYSKADALIQRVLEISC